MGTRYKVNDFLIYEQNSAAKILELVVSKSADMVVIKFEQCNLQYEENLRFYKIKEFTGQIYLKKITNFQNLPVNAHKVMGDLFLKNKPN